MNVCLTRHSPGSTSTTRCGCNFLDHRLKFIGKVAAISAVIELPVVNGHTALHQPISKVPHGGQEDSNASLMRPHMLSLTGYFGHPDGVLLLVEIIQSRGMGVELIARDHNQSPDFWIGWHRWSTLPRFDDFLSSPATGGHRTLNGHGIEIVATNEDPIGALGRLGHLGERRRQNEKHRRLRKSTAAHRQSSHAGQQSYCNAAIRAYA